MSSFRSESLFIYLFTACFQQQRSSQEWTSTSTRPSTSWMAILLGQRRSHQTHCNPRTENTPIQPTTKQMLWHNTSNPRQTTAAKIQNRTCQTPPGRQNAISSTVKTSSVQCLGRWTSNRKTQHHDKSKGHHSKNWQYSNLGNQWKTH